MRNKQQYRNWYKKWYPKYYQENRLLVIKRAAEYRRLNLEKCKLSMRLSRLRQMGLPEVEIVKAKIAAKNHNGKCYACGTNKPKAPRGKSPWCFDHDYSKKNFRGILCFECNSAIGYLSESWKRVQAVATYLRRFR